MSSKNSRNEGIQIIADFNDRAIPLKASAALNGTDQGSPSASAISKSMWQVVPDEWKPRLRAYLRAKCGEDRHQLSAGDFSSEQSVHIHFADGSCALYRHAFAIPDDAG